MKQSAKVFVVNTHTAYDYEHEFDTRVFANERKAREFFASKVKEFREEAQEREGLEVYDQEGRYYNAYIEYSANEFEVYVEISEVEPIE